MSIPIPIPILVPILVPIYNPIPIPIPGSVPTTNLARGVEFSPQSGHTVVVLGDTLQHHMLVGLFSDNVGLF